jgi:hypothetical protein
MSEKGKERIYKTRVSFPLFVNGGWVWKERNISSIVTGVNEVSVLLVWQRKRRSYRRSFQNEIEPPLGSG